MSVIDNTGSVSSLKTQEQLLPQDLKTVLIQDYIKICLRTSIKLLGKCLIETRFIINTDIQMVSEVFELSLK
jgi:hypothetical protein